MQEPGIILYQGLWEGVYFWVVCCGGRAESGCFGGGAGDGAKNGEEVNKFDEN